MKTYIRNILIIISYLSTIPFWRRLFSAKPLLRVWCLHEVKSGQVDIFENKIKYLKNKCNVITPEQFLNNDMTQGKTNILLTFDDGFVSWLDNVLPILKKYEIKAIFFLTRSNEHLASKLMADEHSIGGHSSAHKYLPQLSDAELKNDLINSIKSRFFAYPFGDRQSYNDKVINEVKNAGYQYAFTILPGFNNKKTNPYLLHRDSLDPHISYFIFKLWLKGCYDFKL